MGKTEIPHRSTPSRRCAPALEGSVETHGRGLFSEPFELAGLERFEGMAALATPMIEEAQPLQIAPKAA